MMGDPLPTQGQGLVSGGLDALETIGKKTMEVLSEGDPGVGVCVCVRVVALVLPPYSEHRTGQQACHAGSGDISHSVSTAEGGQEYECHWEGGRGGGE